MDGWELEPHSPPLGSHNESTIENHRSNSMVKQQQADVPTVVSGTSDDDIQTVRSSHFSFGSPSTLSTQQFRDQQRFEVSLGGMQEAPDIEVGTRPSWEIHNNRRTTNPVSPPQDMTQGDEETKDDIQSVEVGSVQTSSSASGNSLIFGGMFRFQNNHNHHRHHQFVQDTDGLSTASPPLPPNNVPILHSLLHPPSSSSPAPSPLPPEDISTSCSTNTAKPRNRLPNFASSQLLFRKRQEASKASQRGLLGASANAKRYRRQVERDTASSSASSASSDPKMSYDLAALPVAANHACHIDEVDATTRQSFLNECSAELTCESGDVASREDTLVDSLQTELDANSKQASLDYYNVPGRQNTGTTTIEEEPQTSSFLTLSTRNTDAASNAAEVGSKEDTIGDGLVGKRQETKVPRIMPSPTQSTGAPSSDDDDDDIYTTPLSTSRNDLSSSGHTSSHGSTVSDVRQVARQNSDKDPGSFDFSVHGNFSVEQASLDIAMERGRTMAHQAQASLTSLADDSRRINLGADIPVTIHTSPPTSEEEVAAAAPVVVPKNHQRRRNRCICVWLVLLCTLVMIGAIASALCGLGKCQAIGFRTSPTTSTEDPDVTVVGGAETVIDPEIPKGPTMPPTSMPVGPLTIRDPPLPNDTILPVPPTGPPTSMPIESPVSQIQTIGPVVGQTPRSTGNPTFQPSSASPTQRPTRVPTTPRPTRAPQTFPVFISPTNSPSNSPTRNPTRSPSQRPVPNPIALPTASPISSSSLRVSSRAALWAAIDAYLDGTMEIPIGNWDVSEITDFSLAFSAGRNRKAASFNEDLTNWNTKNAVSMRRMVCDVILAYLLF